VWSSSTVCREPEAALLAAAFLVNDRNNSSTYLSEHSPDPDPDLSPDSSDLGVLLALLLARLDSIQYNCQGDDEVFEMLGRSEGVKGCLIGSEGRE